MSEVSNGQVNYLVFLALVVVIFLVVEVDLGVF